MSAHVSDQHLAKLYRMMPRAVTIMQLPRLTNALKLSELTLLAQDAIGRLPADRHEARALADVLLYLPTEYRLTNRCIALLDHIQDIIAERRHTVH